MIILASKIKDMPNIFKTRKTKEEKLIKMFNELPDKANEMKLSLDTLKGLLVLILMVFCILYILFYLLSAIFINSFAFTILSILLIYFTLKTLLNFLKGMNDIQDVKVEGLLFSLINTAIDFMYIGYVFFNVYKMW